MSTEIHPQADVYVGDCLQIMRTMPTDIVALVLCSPPYEGQRSYDIGFDLIGQVWVDWAIERYLECIRICSGLVCWVVEGRTKDYRYSATPIKLMEALDRRGVHLRKPPIYQRVGIPGSGGPDFWRNDYEFCVCATSGGRLPWSDNTVMGHPPKYAPGGPMSHRRRDGSRKNSDKPDEAQPYTPPKLANPGNCIKCIVGGGTMGSDLAHENEAPFPENLAEHFVRSFCPPGGIVLDPFCGSGTAGAVAIRWGRKFIGIDIRESQVELTKRRLAEVQRGLAVATVA